MAKKKNVLVAVGAPASGGELAAKGHLPEAAIKNLKILNTRLLKDTTELREENRQLRSELASLAADHDILAETERGVCLLVISSSLSDAAARSTAEMAAATETARMMLKKAEWATAELNAALAVVGREKDGVERDLDKKTKELVDLEESCRSMERAFTEMSKEREAVHVKFRKLEEEGKRMKEELRSVMRERDLLVEKSVREMEVMRSQKDVDMDTLNAMYKSNASKVEALEEECRSLKEIRGQLEDEVGKWKDSLDELKKEKAALVASYADSEKRHERLQDDIFVCLVNEKLEIEKNFDMKEKEMTMQISELKENMTKMEAEKYLVHQRSKEYEIQISNLQAEMSDLQTARKSLEVTHNSCREKVAIMESYKQREKNVKAEAVALKMQLNESMKAKHMMEIAIEEVQGRLNHLTTENVETKKQIDSLMVEKASLEKHLETSNQGLQDAEKKLKALEDASGQVLSLLKKMTAEVMDEERTKENCFSRETGEELMNVEEMKLFVDSIEAIKLAVKNKETKINDLNQKLELLQLSVAHAKRKGGIWIWLFPATTTIFAAASLAYAARSR